MLQKDQPSYSAFKGLLSAFVSAVQVFFDAPLIYSPLLDRLVASVYSSNLTMHFMPLATWITLIEFFFTLFVLWAILHLCGKRTEIILIVIIGVVASLFVGKYVFG